MSMNGGVVPGGIWRTVRLGNGRHLRHRDVHVRAGLEENLDDAAAVHRLRFDVLDVVDRGGERALVHGPDALFHLLGRSARCNSKAPRPPECRRWGKFGRRAQDDQRADHQDQQRQHDERIGAL